MTNELNKIIFEVYNSVLDMDYSKNKSNNLWDKVVKLVRYIETGYIFSVKKNRVLMQKRNEFIATDKIYPDVKFVIYTVSTGRYDVIKEPIYYDDKIDYVVFTDQEISVKSVWKKKEIPQYLSEFSALEKARFIKTHPHLFFDKYEYSMFIDGNIRITCDVKPMLFTMIEKKRIIAMHRHQTRNCVYEEAKAIEAAGKAKHKILYNQINSYKRNGFPPHYGLFETNIIIREHNNPNCINIMVSWWNEISKWTKRDQLSFTYVLWKNKYKSDYVMSLGNNSRRNPYFIVDSHS